MRAFVFVNLINNSYNSSRFSALANSDSRADALSLSRRTSPFASLICSTCLFSALLRASQVLRKDALRQSLTHSSSRCCIRTWSNFPLYLSSCRNAAARFIIILIRAQTDLSTSYHAYNIITSPVIPLFVTWRRVSKDSRVSGANDSLIRSFLRKEERGSTRGQSRFKNSLLRILGALLSRDSSLFRLSRSGNVTLPPVSSKVLPRDET